MAKLDYALRAEVDELASWLTGYTLEQIDALLSDDALAPWQAIVAPWQAIVAPWQAIVAPWQAIVAACIAAVIASAAGMLIRRHSP